jgi:trehalose synthase
MAALTDVLVPVRDIDRFIPVAGAEQVAAVHAAAAQVKARLGDGAIWNVNSTAVGGGVAEMLQPLIGYGRGVGLDVRWVVIGGEREFFHITKRLHHHLHGSAGDGGPLGDDERPVYEEVLRESTAVLAGRIRAGDVVILHDPQTAGMAPLLVRAGARVVWRCHIGHDRRSPEVDRGWAFLAPYLEPVRRFVFSRRAYVPTLLAGREISIIPPSIDAFAPKNEELDEDTIRSILVQVGLVEGPPPDAPRPGFTRGDGTPGRVERAADILRLGRAPTWDTPLVVQVSRWDPLKDMLGVMGGFALLGQTGPLAPALVLAGPNVNAVADDPEGPAVFADVVTAWRALPHATRHRVHLANLPTADVEENAAIVNALQRHATVVVQKSLHEGFGLTVTEAMWKGRAVIASAVGGIRDQIEDGVSGLLLADPADLPGFARLLERVLGDPAEAARLGDAARQRVRAHFLGLRHLLQYGELITGFES